jgi:hypothetical protein
MLTVMVIGMTLIPVGAALDIRGWSEMHPLNGPSWSLFYEYVANILYALFVRKFSKTVLACFVFVTGCVLVHYCLTGSNGDVIGGWSLEPVQMRIGLTRLLYPFFAGLLPSRIVTVGRIRHAFLLSSVIIIAALAWPRVGGPADLWKNGLYDALCIVLVFPLVVYISASGSERRAWAPGSAAFWRDLLSHLHHPLPVRVHLYCLGQPAQDSAGGRIAHDHRHVRPASQPPISA